MNSSGSLPFSGQAVKFDAVKFDQAGSCPAPGDSGCPTDDPVGQSWCFQGQSGNLPCPGSGMSGPGLSAGGYIGGTTNTHETQFICQLG